RRERVRALLERRGPERRGAAGQEARLRLREALAEILALGAKLVLLVDEAHRALELLLAVGDPPADVLPIVEDRLDDAPVDHHEDRQAEGAENPATIALRVAVVPGERTLPERAHVERQLHFATSAVSAKRSLSPCLVVGELKVTFLKR